jgi:chitodextrinase
LQAPTIPSGLTAQEITNNSISIRWNSSTDNRTVKAYEVYVDDKLVTTSTLSNFKITGLAEFKDHSIRVAAVDSSDNVSAKSSAISAKTLDRTAPTLPTGFTQSEVKDHSFKVSWLPSTDAGGSGVSHYEVYLNGALMNGKVTDTSFVFTKLVPAKAYNVKLIARDIAGNPTAFTPIYVVTTAKDTTPPSTPGVLSASLIKSTSLRISWPISNDNVAVSGYEIHVNGSLFLDSKSVANAVDLIGLKNFTSYKIKVRAYDANRNYSAFNPEIAVRTLDTIKPPAPTNLKVTELNRTTVRLSWAAVKDDSGINTYDIYINGFKKGTTKTLSFDVIGLTSVSNKFQVMAIDNAKNSSVLSASVTYTRRSVLDIKGKTILVNGKLLTLPAGITPVVRNGSSFVPAKPIFEALGYKFVYDTKLKLVTITNSTYRLSFTVGKSAYRVNNTIVKTFTVLPYEATGSVMMPAKFFQTELNMIVNFSSK